MKNLFIILFLGVGQFSTHAQDSLWLNSDNTKFMLWNDYSISLFDTLGNSNLYYSAQHGLLTGQFKIYDWENKHQRKPQLITRKESLDFDEFHFVGANIPLDCFRYEIILLDSIEMWQYPCSQATEMDSGMEYEFSVEFYMDDILIFTEMRRDFNYSYHF